VTTDFFTPVVDDPYDYGAIAAANALSDLYAMGARPLFALNIAAMPSNLHHEIVREILRGGAEKVREAGAVIAGGHSISDDEPKYGLVAIGVAASDELLTKASARPGETLFLTKPLGTGVTTTALRNGSAEDSDVEQAVRWMSRLNAGAAQLALASNVRAATDITGFSLLGHGVEMAQASGVSLQFYLNSIPFLAGARAYVEGGNLPGGSADNRLFFERHVTFDETIDEYNKMLLFDAQTSGGLLLSVADQEVEGLLERAARDNIPVWAIGRVQTGTGVTVVDDLLESPTGAGAQVEEIWFAG
jgi:selenide,water dikinase